MTQLFFWVYSVAQRNRMMWSRGIAVKVQVSPAGGASVPAETSSRFPALFHTTALIHAIISSCKHLEADPEKKKSPYVLLLLLLILIFILLFANCWFYFCNPTVIDEQSPRCAAHE